MPWNGSRRFEWSSCPEEERAWAHRESNAWGVRFRKLLSSRILNTYLKAAAKEISKENDVECEWIIVMFTLMSIVYIKIICPWPGIFIRQTTLRRKSARWEHDRVFNETLGLERGILQWIGIPTVKSAAIIHDSVCVFNILKIECSDRLLYR